MSHSAEPVSVIILEKKYQFACDPEQRSDLIEAARNLDECMSEIRDSGRLLSLERIALQAALEIGVQHRPLTDEDQGEDPNEGVHAHLGQQTREHRRDRCRRRVVRGRQPEVQREQRCLDTESGQEETRESGHQLRSLRRHRWHTNCQLAKVQGPRGAVDDAHTGEEERR